MFLLEEPTAVREETDLSAVEDRKEPLSSVDHAWLRMDEPTIVP